MKINVVIETKDRRLKGHVNYLAVTLGNLKRAGVFQSEHLNSFIIVSGGEMEGFYQEEIYPILGRDGIPHQFVHCPPEGCTRQQNAARAIRYGAMNQGGEWVLKLEDDLDVLDDFFGNVSRWLDDYGRATVPMFALAATYETLSRSRYATAGESVVGPGTSFPYVRAQLGTGRRALTHPCRGFWGAQALLWRRPIAEHLGAWLGPDPFLWDGREEHRERGHDLLLQVWGQKWCQETGVRPVFGVAIPSFVQHIGRSSNLDQPEINHVQKFFEFPFPGRSWCYGKA